MPDEDVERLVLGILAPHWDKLHNQWFYKGLPIPDVVFDANVKMDWLEWDYGEDDAVISIAIRDGQLVIRFIFYRFGEERERKEWALTISDPDFLKKAQDAVRGIFEK